METLSLGLLALLLMACNLCSNRGAQATYSPDRRFKAVTFTRNCGATTDWNSQVSILRAEESLGNEIGNVFAVSASSEAPTVTTVWTSSNTLVIRHKKNEHVFRAETTFRGVAVSYDYEE